MSLEKPLEKSWADMVDEDEQEQALLITQQQQEETVNDVEETVEKAKETIKKVKETVEEKKVQEEIVKEIVKEEKEQVEEKKQVKEEIQEKPKLTGSKASRWANAPDEPVKESWKNKTTSTATGTGASKWANAEDNSRYTRRYDNNRNKPVDFYSKLNKSDFVAREPINSRNGGFDNMENFTRENRFKAYQELQDEHQAIQNWRNYTPPVNKKDNVKKEQQQQQQQQQQPIPSQNVEKDQQPSITKQNIEKPIVIQETPVKKDYLDIKTKYEPFSSPSGFSWADDIPGESSSDEDEPSFMQDKVDSPVDNQTPTIEANKNIKETFNQASNNDTSIVETKDEPQVTINSWGAFADTFKYQAQTSPDLSVNKSSKSQKDDWKKAAEWDATPELEQTTLDNPASEPQQDSWNSKQPVSKQQESWDIWQQNDSPNAQTQDTWQQNDSQNSQIKDTWKNKIHVANTDNTSQWKSFSEIEITRSPPKKHMNVQKPSYDLSHFEEKEKQSKIPEPKEVSFSLKELEKKPQEISFSLNELEKKPKEVSFSLNELEKKPKEVSFSLNELERQPKEVSFSLNELEKKPQEISFSLGELERQPKEVSFSLYDLDNVKKPKEVSFSLSELEQEKPKDISFRLNDSQVKEPQAVSLSLSELTTKQPKEISLSWADFADQEIKSTNEPQRKPREISLKLSDF